MWGPSTLQKLRRKKKGSSSGGRVKCRHETPQCFYKSEVDAKDATIIRLWDTLRFKLRRIKFVTQVLPAPKKRKKTLVKVPFILLRLVSMHRQNWFQWTYMCRWIAALILYVDYLELHVVRLSLKVRECLFSKNL